ncbi:MAG: hydroxyacid dehydrogenase [Chloroflexi bacterium]|nr:hydroxyacid dehydrogenase [Chloroflexota bacterium]
MAPSELPSILVLVPDQLYRELFTPEMDALLRSLGNVEFADEAGMSHGGLAARVSQFDCCVTGWGSPHFSDDVLDAAGRLRLVAHSAGSVKGLISPTAFDRGIAITHAASAIAYAVADMSMLLMWLALRQVHAYDRALKAGASWQECQRSGYPQRRDRRDAGLGREMTGQRVGVVGAGYTGRCLIALLKRLDCDVWVYDPYLSDQRAAEMGVRKVGLHELLTQCRLVSLQLPSTDETRRMIGARELALLPDGAILTNTSRSWVVDESALLAELATGRIQAALDVFDEEPLPEDSPFRLLDNVILTPHVAGATTEARERQGCVIVEEIQRFFAGEPLRYGVTAEMWSIMA